MPYAWYDGYPGGACGCCYGVARKTEGVSPGPAEVGKRHASGRRPRAALSAGGGRSAHLLVRRVRLRLLVLLGMVRVQEVAQLWPRPVALARVRMPILVQRRAAGRRRQERLARRRDAAPRAVEPAPCALGAVAVQVRPVALTAREVLVNRELVRVRWERRRRRRG